MRFCYLCSFRFFASLLFALFVVAIFSSCAKKDKNEFNKPAMYWYENIMREVKFGNLEGADNFYASLQSEHMNSPLVPEAQMILGQAHMRAHEYLLAEFYFDEYLKRFATAKNYDYVSYLKLQSRYYGIRNFSKDQEFFTATLSDFEAFLERFPNSVYAPFVKTMQVRFVLGQNELNKGIVNVYKKQRKKEGVEKYTDRIDTALESSTKPKRSHIPFYVRLFNW